MLKLNWELEVLSRAIIYQNLSTAALHIGLSQPQLSRIISKLESEFQTALLDRQSRRKSGWLPLAFKLSEIYLKHVKQAEKDIQNILDDTQIDHLKIGTLEGLSELASQTSHFLLKKTSLQKIELDIYDLNELEELFLKNNFDLIFTIRLPNNRKYRFSKILGYQNYQNISSNPQLLVMSAYEYGIKYGHRSTKRSSKILVSNSLNIRKNWLEKFGGKGILPTPMMKYASSKTKEVPVILLAQDSMNLHIWDHLLNFDNAL